MSVPTASNYSDLLNQAMTEFYFDEIIKVHNIDHEVVYDKVSRVQAKSQDGDFYLELDVNKELYPMLPGEKYMVISKTLLMDGSAVTGYFPESGLYFIWRTSVDAER